jgi:hypothetical protein
MLRKLAIYFLAIGFGKLASAAIFAWKDRYRGRRVLENK